MVLVVPGSTGHQRAVFREQKKIVCDNTLCFLSGFMEMLFTEYKGLYIFGCLGRGIGRLYSNDGLLHFKRLIRFHRHKECLGSRHGHDVYLQITT